MVLGLEPELELGPGLELELELGLELGLEVVVEGVELAEPAVGRR